MHDQKKRTEQKQNHDQLSEEDLGMVAGGRGLSVEEPAEPTFSHPV
jgi:hypothetical protein